MSKFSGKCDFCDIIEINGLENILKSQVCLSSSEAPLELHSIKDCIPYYQHIVIASSTTKGVGTYILTDKPWTQIERERSGNPNSHRFYDKELRKEMVKYGIIKEKRRLILDADDTVMDTTRTIVALYNEDFRAYSDWRYIYPEEIGTWDFKELSCASSEYLSTYFNQPRFFQTWCVNRGFREAAKKLINDYDISICSLGYSPNLRLKEEYFAKYCPEFDFIGVNIEKYQDKSHIDMAGAIFIDDVSKNLFTSNAKTKILFGPKRPWNENWDGLRAYTWQEVMNLLQKFNDTDHYSISGLGKGGSK